MKKAHYPGQDENNSIYSIHMLRFVDEACREVIEVVVRFIDVLPGIKVKVRLDSYDMVRDLIW